MQRTILSIPPKVDLKDLKENGLLVSEAEKAEMLAVTDQGRISKKSKDHHLTYSLIVDDEGQHFAVYKGAQQGKELGKGAFGVVKLAQHLETGEWVALKTQEINKNNTQEFIAAETKMLKKATKFGSNLFIEQKLGSSAKPKSNTIMKLAGGVSLRALIEEDRKIWSPHEMVDVAIKVCESINKMHQLGIIHRDIKPANMIVEPASHDVSVVDFGFACDKYTQFDGVMGTPEYMAPEIFNKHMYGVKTDTYATGVALAEWLGMKIDYKGEGARRFVDKVEEGPLSKILIPDDEVRQQIVNLVNGMVKFDFDERRNIADALKELTALYSNMGFSCQRDLSVGTLDIGEYNQMSKNEKKDLLRCLKQFDRVVIVGDQAAKINPFDIAKLHRELTGNGVACINQSFHYAKKEELISGVRNMLEQQSNLQNYHVCHVTRDSKTAGIDQKAVIQVEHAKSKAEYQASIDASYRLNTVSDQDMNKIIKQLEAEARRVETKYAKSKPAYAEKITGLINGSLDNIKKQQGQNYNQMSVTLSRLEKDIGATKKPGFLPKILQGEKHAQKRIRKTIAESTVHSERRRP